MNERVAEGDKFDPHDFNLEVKADRCLSEQTLCYIPYGVYTVYYTHHHVVEGAYTLFNKYMRTPNCWLEIIDSHPC